MNAYNVGGLGRLRPRNAKGAVGKISAEGAEKVCHWVNEGPAGQGLD